MPQSGSSAVLAIRNINAHWVKELTVLGQVMRTAAIAFSSIVAAFLTGGVILGQVESDSVERRELVQEGDIDRNGHVEIEDATVPVPLAEPPRCVLGEDGSRSTGARAKQATRWPSLPSHPLRADSPSELRCAPRSHQASQPEACPLHGV